MNTKPETKNVLPAVMLAVTACGILILAVACEVNDGGSSESGRSTSREQVLDNQSADFERLFERYIACMEKKHPPNLEEDFFAFHESLREYQLSPSANNRDKYLLLRKNVEVQLDNC